MTNQGENNIKLGAFVLAGFFVLILSFYMIGKNQNMFGSHFYLKARFYNLNGLIEGNNILFSGIQAGTVKDIKLINDTTIEVNMLMDNKIKAYIHKNAIASISTEGLMGNKIVSIAPVNGQSPLVVDGDVLATQKLISADDMLQTLSKTNNNVAVISEAIKETVLGIDKSALWDVFNDKRIGNSLKASLKNIDQTTANANKITRDLNSIVEKIKAGKGSAGVLLSDTAFAGSLKDAMTKIKSASNNANQMMVQLNSMVGEIKQDVTNGKGSVNALLKDSVMARNLIKSMDNIQKGTDGFNQDMEVLKHNFLLRGYFKNLEKQKKKEAKQTPVN
ncbi:MAG: MlaD family protein [Mucilaginibacter sp.]